MSSSRPDRRARDTRRQRRPPVATAGHAAMDEDTADGRLSGEGMEFSVPTGLQLCTTFEALDLKPDLLRGVYAYGFEKPSAIQQRAIRPILSGRDVIAQAQSGTGKTATFSIGILNRIDTNSRECQALILSPTRELAIQSESVVKTLGAFMSVKAHCCIGGKSVGEDIRVLEAGVHVVSGESRVVHLVEEVLSGLCDSKAMTRFLCRYAGACV